MKLEAGSIESSAAARVLERHDPSRCQSETVIVSIFGGAGMVQSFG